jgi:hypothetical protein
VADSPVFEWTCEALEQATSFDRLAARGTLRLVLKAAGLDARSVSNQQMDAVLRRALPGELASRGVAASDSVASRIADGLATARLDEAAAKDTPEAVFSRLGGA